MRTFVTHGAVHADARTSSLRHRHVRPGLAATGLIRLGNPLLGRDKQSQSFASRALLPPRVLGVLAPASPTTLTHTENPRPRRFKSLCARLELRPPSLRLRITLHTYQVDHPCPRTNAAPLCDAYGSQAFPSSVCTTPYHNLTACAARSPPPIFASRACTSPCFIALASSTPNPQSYNAPLAV